MIEVTDATFHDEVTLSQKPVLVDFYAPWCSPCVSMAQVIEELEQDNQEVKFVKMNVDGNEVIPSMVGVRSVPTLAAFAGGELTGTWFGSKAKPQVDAIVQGLK